MPPIRSARSSTQPPRSTAGYQWRFHRSWPGIPRAASPRLARMSPAGQPANFFVRSQGRPGVPDRGVNLAGVPINVTLVSREQYLAAAEAYLRGIDVASPRGTHSEGGSVASLFISRWDKAVRTTCRTTFEIARDRDRPANLPRYRELLESPRWRALAAAGAQSSAPARGREPGPGFRRIAKRFISRPSQHPKPSTPFRRRHCVPSPNTDSSSGSWPRRRRRRSRARRVCAGRHQR